LRRSDACVRRLASWLFGLDRDQIQPRLARLSDRRVVADDDRGGRFEAELVNDTWRLVRRARTN
jgi:hypothetical protein